MLRLINKKLQKHTRKNSKSLHSLFVSVLDTSFILMCINKVLKNKTILVIWKYFILFLYIK